RGVENLGGKLGRRFERAGTGEDAKVGGLELECHGRSRDLLLLEPRRDALCLIPQDAFERAEIGNVARKGGLRRHALGLAIGADFAVIEPAREAPQPAALDTELAYQVGFIGALQVSNDGKSSARKRRAGRLAD